MTIQTTAAPKEHQARSADRPKFLALEMQVGGHHPSYIRNFTAQWQRRIDFAEIDFLVSREFFRRHLDVVQQIERLDQGRIRIHQLSESEDHDVRYSNRFREFAGWKIFCRWAEQFGSSHGLLMYSDHFQLPMLLGKSAPCPVSCIYFRPTFHYSRFTEFEPTMGQKLAAIRKKLMLSRLLKLPQLHSLFCLDPFAVEYIAREMTDRVEVLQLPDSFVRQEVPAAELDSLRQELGIDGNRKVLLLLGIIDSRKGPIQLLEAISKVDHELLQRCCLLIAGKIQEEIESDVVSLVEQIRSETPLQLVLHPHYIDDTLVQHYYEIADVALTTYQRHMGMSSALIRAALAKIPVLSSGYGLMGELVRQHGLGMVTDTESPSEFRNSLASAIGADPSELFDVSSATQFEQDHSPAALGDTLERWVRSAIGVASANGS